MLNPDRKWRPARSKRESKSVFVTEPLEQRTLLAATAFRPPSVPLITSDPYLSIWSESVNLTDTNTVSWTGQQQSLVSLIRIDGTSYRLMGDDPSTLPAFPQADVTVLPTRSIYDFDNGHVHVTMTFMQPALGSNLSALSLPLSYITWAVYSDDGLTHSVQIYDSTSSQLAVNNSSQVVTWQRGATDGMTTLDIGTTAQTYFNPVGDQVNIDWGYAYTAASAGQSTSSIGYDTTEINTFESAGALTNTDDANVPRAVSNNQPVMAYAFDLGTVGSVIVSRHVIVAYDEVYSVDYFGDYLIPYWSRNGTTVQQMLTQAQNNYSLYSSECAAFDSQLMSDMTAQGGSQYATLGGLYYRQTFASTGLAADANGQPLLFTKEDTSNGDIATVDVIFPTFPQLLLFSPTLAEAAVQTVMEYSNSSLWTQSYAPHDLGTYPNAAGQGTGNDGNETMPVETTADLIIMLDAISQEQHSTAFADQFWPLISNWANYLVPYAYTPGNQLTSNDFLGTLTNSTNLACKAIVALGAYANMCTMMGNTAVASSYISTAQADVTHWMQQSISSDGTHWLFEYGDQGTGVQLYNLAMDSILGLNLFPSSVAALDISYAKSIEQPYGVPIASVTTRASVEWSMWEFSMATNLTDFETLVTPIYNYLNTTTDLVPGSDLNTDNGNGSGSSYFHARSVVGGVFVELLTNKALWNRYASQDTTVLGTFAPFPAKTVITPSAEESASNWKYTTSTPAANWYQSGFNTSSWSTGLGGFGSTGTPGIIINTQWTTSNIYLVRTFTMPSGSFTNPEFEVFHDEDVAIYINGILAASETGYITSYEDLQMSSAAQQQLVAGQTVTLAVSCLNTTGGQGVDVGIVSFGASTAVTTAVASTTVPGLNISQGQDLALTAPAGTPTPAVLTVGSLTIAGSTGGWSGQLDITGNDLVVQNGNLSQVTNQISTGYDLTDGATWTGDGITSSVAAADTTHLTAVGVELNNDGNGNAIFGTGTSLGPFDGQSPGPNDVLVKYTYFGDANLDGKVDGSDYSKIDAGYASHGALTGWANGDFNYDGVIDGSDYSLIDNAFNNQNAVTLASSAAASAQVASASVGRALPATVFAAGSARPTSTPNIKLSKIAPAGAFAAGPFVGFQSSAPIAFTGPDSAALELSGRKKDAVDALSAVPDLA
jgi:hypothetical protein